jgi:hypothetical protein
MRSRGAGGFSCSRRQRSSPLVITVSSGCPLQAGGWQNTHADVSAWTCAAPKCSRDTGRRWSWAVAHARRLMHDEACIGEALPRTRVSRERSRTEGAAVPGRAAPGTALSRASLGLRAGGRLCGKLEQHVHFGANSPFVFRNQPGKLTPADQFATVSRTDGRYYSQRQNRQGVQ